MFGLIGLGLAFVYTLVMGFGYGLSFWQIHLLVSDFLFEYYILSIAASVAWVIYIVVCAALDVDMFGLQQLHTKVFLSMQPSNMILLVANFVVKYALLLSGARFLFNSYAGEQFSVWLYAVGLLMLILGTLWGTLTLNFVLRITSKRTMIIR